MTFKCAHCLDTRRGNALISYCIHCVAPATQPTVLELRRPWEAAELDRLITEQARDMRRYRAGGHYVDSLDDRATSSGLERHELIGAEDPALTALMDVAA